MINYCGCFQFWPNKLKGKGKYLLPLCSNLRLRLKSVKFKIEFSFPCPFHLFFVGVQVKLMITEIRNSKSM